MRDKQEWADTASRCIPGRTCFHIKKSEEDLTVYSQREQQVLKLEAISFQLRNLL